MRGVAVPPSAQKPKRSIKPPSGWSRATRSFSCQGQTQTGPAATRRPPAASNVEHHVPPHGQYDRVLDALRPSCPPWPSTSTPPGPTCSPSPPSPARSGGRFGPTTRRNDSTTKSAGAPTSSGSFPTGPLTAIDVAEPGRCAVAAEGAAPALRCWKLLALLHAMRRRSILVGRREPEDLKVSE